MVIAVKSKSHIFLWFGFWVTGLLTWIVYACWPDFFVYLLIYPVLAAVQVMLGLWLLKKARFARRKVILVVMGIIVGQLWVILCGVGLLCWYFDIYIGIFAPC